MSFVKPDYPFAEASLAVTHEVQNQPIALENYNVFESDTALREMAARFGAEAYGVDLLACGEWAGRAATIELGFQANEQKPVLYTHDRFGHRVDLVKFHPAYHALMQHALENGLHSGPGPTPARALMLSAPARIICRPRWRPATAARSP